MLVHESLSIVVVRQGLISEFLTVKDFIFKLDASNANCVSSDPITKLFAGASLSSKRSSSERALGKKILASFKIS